MWPGAGVVDNCRRQLGRANRMRRQAILLREAVQIANVEKQKEMEKARLL
jgi:hypothetical protein